MDVATGIALILSVLSFYYSALRKKTTLNIDLFYHQIVPSKVQTK